MSFDTNSTTNLDGTDLKFDTTGTAGSITGASATVTLTPSKKHVIEAYTHIDETAKIHGVALIPRISRNNNLYTKEELRRFDNVTVPISWEHNGQNIGTATFHYNQELETVYYEGEVTDERAASVVKNKTLYTSIEADPTAMQDVCNSPTDCFHMPFGLKPVGLALTETPGVPETSVNVIERMIKEHCIEQKDKHPNCIGDLDWQINRCEDTDKGDDCVQNMISKLAKEDPDKPEDQRVAIAFSKCGMSKNEAIVYLYQEFKKLKESIFCTECGELKKN